MQRKIHNQTIFVAAFAVYLGLALVGAPPHVLAQQQIVHQPVGNFNLKKADNNDCKNLTVAELVKIFAEQNGDLTNVVPTTFSSKRIYRNGRSVSVEILAEKGDEKIIKFFRNRVSCKENPRFGFGLLDTPTSSVFNFQISPAEVVCNATHSFAKPETAKRYAEANKKLFEVVAEKRAELRQVTATEKLDFLVVKNTDIKFENDQVFIVTRLPRAGLDSLLKADEKAN